MACQAGLRDFRARLKVLLQHFELAVVGLRRKRFAFAGRHGNRDKQTRRQRECPDEPVPHCVCSCSSADALTEKGMLLSASACVTADVILNSP
jgi:hypothetical protein